MRPKLTNIVDRPSYTATDRPAIKDVKPQREVDRSDNPIAHAIRPCIRLVESPGGHPLISILNGLIN